MPSTPSSPRALLKTVLRWGLLFALTALLSFCLTILAIPAAYMLSAIISALIISLLNQSVVLPRWLFLTGQGVIGAMIAHTIPTAIFGQFGTHLPLVLGGVCSVLLLSNGLGIFLTKRHLLPGTTAIWGISPGAATAMTIMAEEFGADVRLVALMQYLRVIMVALVAIGVAHFSAGKTDHTLLHHTLSWHIANIVNGTHGANSMDPKQFAATLVLIVVGVIAGIRLKIGAGPLLLTLGLALISSNTGVITLTLPHPLLVISYVFIGWNIGFRFNRQSLQYALALFPRILFSIILLISACALLSHLLVIFLGIDSLTAYLAMSPGGADSVAIIAASSHVDMSFVMTMQTGRLILVFLSGPSLARYIASRQKKSLEISSHGKIT